MRDNRILKALILVRYVKIIADFFDYKGKSDKVQTQLVRSCSYLTTVCYMITVVDDW